MKEGRPYCYKNLSASTKISYDMNLYYANETVGSSPAFISETLCGRAFLDKLTVAQLAQKSYDIYRNRNLITVFNTGSRSSNDSETVESNLHPHSQFPYDPF
jgi:hypothetical protein